MIDNDLIQAGIVAKLKADTTLISYLATFSAGAEVREAEYQSREFVYPNVRVELGTQIEEGDPPCYSLIPLTIYSYSETDSSQQVNHLAGLVNAALLRKQFTGTGFRSGLIISDGNIAGRRTTERVWQAVNQYRCNIYGGNFD